MASPGAGAAAGARGGEQGEVRAWLGGEGGLAAHSWALALPAAAAWACALVLLGCPAAVGAVVSALASLGALGVALSGRVSIGSLPEVRRLARRTCGEVRRLARRTHGEVRRPARRTHRVTVPGRTNKGAASGKLWRNALIAVLGCSAAASASVAFRVHAVSTGPVADLAARGASVAGEIELTGDPRVRPGRGVFRQESVVAEATLVSVQARDVRLAVHTPVVVFASGREWRALLPSQRLRVTGRLARPEPGELVGAIFLVRGPPQVLTGPSPVQAAAGELRAGLRQAADVLPPDQRGLLPGLVVGDVSRMDPHVTADFQAAGLSHLNAVSGANLAIVAGAAIALSRMAGMPLTVRAMVAAVAMIAFAVVARPSPSVLRALLMGLAAALALGTGRSKDGVAALSASVLLLIMFDPELARSYGFALSVSATAGILLLAPRWRDRLAVRMPRWAAEAVAVPAAAQVAVTPVLVLMSGQLALVAIPANLLAGPAVAPATLLGFAAAVVAPLWPTAAQALVIPAGYAVGWIIVVAGHAAQLPMGTLPWPGGLLGLGLLAAAVAIAIPLLRRASWRSVVLTVGVAGLAGALVVGPVVAPWPPPRWLLVACDVGQGDGLVVAAGADRAVVVDTGPDPVVMDRCLSELGIREVPLLILTHEHADHVGGVRGVFRGRRVGTVLVSPRHTSTTTGPATSESWPGGTDRASGVSSVARGPWPGDASRASVRSLLAPGGWAGETDGVAGHASVGGRSARAGEAGGRWPGLEGVDQQVAVPGNRWVFGPSEVTVLGPVGETTEGGLGEGSVANNSSVVVVVRWRAGSIVLSGDIETEAQAALLREVAPRADLLKVPHHGSARQDPAFLAAVGARAALISVGADNDYGHPSPATLGLLHRLGVRVYRTDQSGALAVVDQAGALAIMAHGKSTTAAMGDEGG